MIISCSVVDGADITNDKAGQRITSVNPRKYADQNLAPGAQARAAR
jgi:hypothetical protein